MFFIPVDVEAHAGHKADETPRAFWWRGERIELEEIVDRWYEGGVDPTRPVSDYFKGRTSKGTTHLLKLDHGSGQWSLVEGFKPRAGR